MNDGSPAFERAADELERLSHMSRLETRGTLRIALKDAGLLPRGVNYRSMLVVFERVLPTMLVKRGVRGGAEICRTIAASLRDRAGMEGSEGDTPEKVFSRLGAAGRGTVVPAAPSSSEGASSPPGRSETDTGRLSAVPKEPGGRR